MLIRIIKVCTFIPMHERVIRVSGSNSVRLIIAEFAASDIEFRGKLACG